MDKRSYSHHRKQGQTQDVGLTEGPMWCHITVQRRCCFWRLLVTRSVWATALTRAPSVAGNGPAVPRADGPLSLPASLDSGNISAPFNAACGHGCRHEAQHSSTTSKSGYVFSKANPKTSCAVRQHLGQSIQLHLWKLFQRCSVGGNS